MADLTFTANLGRPGHQATTIGPITSAATGALLDAVTIDTNGKAAKTSGASGKCSGIVVAAKNVSAAGAYAAGVGLTLVTFGPVRGYSGLTPGKLVYLASTGGKLADSGSVPVGYAIDDTTIFFMPGIANAAS